MNTVSNLLKRAKNVFIHRINYNCAKGDFRSACSKFQIITERTIDDLTTVRSA